MANAGVNAILIKIAAIGLKPIHLGKSIAQMYPLLCKMVTISQSCCISSKYLVL